VDQDEQDQQIQKAVQKALEEEREKERSLRRMREANTSPAWEEFKQSPVAIIIVAVVLAVIVARGCG